MVLHTHAFTLSEEAFLFSLIHPGNLYSKEKSKILKLAFLVGDMMHDMVDINHMFMGFRGTYFILR